LRFSLFAFNGADFTRTFASPYEKRTRVKVTYYAQWLPCPDEACAQQCSCDCGVITEIIGL